MKALSVAVACALFVTAITRAHAGTVGFEVTIDQVGSTVVATGSGAIDTTGFPGSFANGTASAGIEADAGYIYLGSGEYAGYGLAITGPSNFGSGSFDPATSSSGDAVGIHPSIVSTIYVPYGYISGTPLSDTATWDAATIASLGLTSGIYVWTYGPSTDQIFTVDIVAPTAAPLPAALPLFAFGLSGLGLLGWRRKRKVRAP